MLRELAPVQNKNKIHWYFRIETAIPNVMTTGTVKYFIWSRIEFHEYNIQLKLKSYLQH